MALLDTFIGRVITQGTLTVTDHKGATRSYGTATPDFPDVRARFTDSRVARDIIAHPDMGAGEAYMDGRLIIENDDIMGLLTLIRRNMPFERGGRLDDASWLSRALGHVRGKIDRLNWARRSKANVAHHYDLSDQLYELFLDENRQYSCAYYTDPSNSLEQAQRDKLAHIAAKLALQPGQRVLDIGCGWGGMALYLNRVAGVDVTGITLSEEQLRYARAAAEKAGVADKVRFELIDYRDIKGPFDRIVSVGMFEHVGPAHYRQFFNSCRNLLTEDGVMLLHTIGRMCGPGVTDRWTAKYIFPGGYIPALSEIVSVSEKSGLILSDMETLRLHYAYTLRAWYDRVRANRVEIERLYDARFLRMWMFYLSGSAAAFEDGILCNYQLQYVRKRRTLPITRDYLAAAEAKLRAV
jgi:cyclopropane-fatty-acyl-phospholipid synthase